MKMVDKDALVAEIEKLYDEAPTWDDSRHYMCKVLDIIDTLETKELDLEKELIEWHKKHFKKDGTFIGMSGFYLTNNSQMDIAKHFFELGLKAQKGEKNITEIKKGNCYMCLKDVAGYDSFTKGKVYQSLYDNALINDNNIEVLVRPSDYFRIATEQEIKAQKGEEI